MDLNIDKVRILKALADAKADALRQVEATADELRQAIQQAAEVIADHPEEYSILNSEAAFVVDGEVKGHARRFCLQFEGGYPFGRGGVYDELRVPEGKYRALILFVKRPG